jgi:hypothetical protein
LDERGSIDWIYHWAIYRRQFDVTKVDWKQCSMLASALVSVRPCEAGIRWAESVYIRQAYQVDPITSMWLGYISSSASVAVNKSLPCLGAGGHSYGSRKGHFVVYASSSIAQRDNTLRLMLACLFNSHIGFNV